MRVLGHQADNLLLLLKDSSLKLLRYGKIVPSLSQDFAYLVKSSPVHWSGDYIFYC